MSVFYSLPGSNDFLRLCAHLQLLDCLSTLGLNVCHKSEFSGNFHLSKSVCTHIGVTLHWLVGAQLTLEIHFECFALLRKIKALNSEAKGCFCVALLCNPFYLKLQLMLQTVGTTLLS